MIACSVTLHNVNIPEATSLLFQGQEMIPDTTGVGAGSDVEYIFSANRPGTFLYEAGLIPGKQHQVAMGMYGALIVRPSAAGQAYENAESAFTVESTLVLSEIDPALNANPVGFDMRKYAPQVLPDQRQGSSCHKPHRGGSRRSAAAALCQCRPAGSRHEHARYFTNHYRPGWQPLCQSPQDGRRDDRHRPDPGYPPHHPGCGQTAPNLPFTMPT